MGRDVLAADLRRALDGTPGRGSVIIVRGEPGIGKTRLVQEVTSERRALWGRTSSDDRSGTLEPWRRVLRAARRAGIDLGSDALAIAKADPSAPADASLRLEAVVESLHAIAASSSDVVVVLDDVQWADNESLAVLRSFALERDDVDLAVILTDRGGHERPLPRADVVLELAGISPSSVGELIVGVTGAEPTADVVALAAGRTGGNPLFVIEVARALRAAGPRDRCCCVVHRSPRQRALASRRKAPRAARAHPVLSGCSRDPRHGIGPRRDRPARGVPTDRRRSTRSGRRRALASSATWERAVSASTTHSGAKPFSTISGQSSWPSCTAKLLACWRQTAMSAEPGASPATIRRRGRNRRPPGGLGAPATTHRRRPATTRRSVGTAWRSPKRTTTPRNCSSRSPNRSLASASWTRPACSSAMRPRRPALTATPRC